MKNLSATNLLSEKVEELSEQQEHDLIKRCQHGDAQAMEWIVLKYQNQVYNTAYGMLGNPEDAQDITQDVFLAVWEKIGQFRFKSRLSTWIYRIVKNLCINQRRQKERRQTYPMEIDDSQAWAPIETRTPETELLQAERHEMLQTALAQLKDDYRMILTLREMEEMPYSEIAEVLGCSVGRVKSRLYEARMELKTILQRIMGD